MAEDSCYPRKQRQRKHGCKHGSFQNGKNKLLKGWGVRSKKANEEMALYNLTMKVNRLELLKANIGLEMIAGTDELDKYMAEILQGRTMDELKRMGGILGESVKVNSKNAQAIPNASFHNATFSNRIWMYQDLLKADLSKLLQTGLIQGKNPRALASELKKLFDTSTYNAERLMRTELARVQTEAQKQSFERNGFSSYEYIANSNCCDVCQGLNGKHFKVESMTPGENAPPMHPHCRCSTAAWEDSEEYDAWVDYLASGGTTEEWNERKSIVLPQRSSGKAGYTDGYTVIDSVQPFDFTDSEAIKKEVNAFLNEFSDAKEEHAVIISPIGKLFRLTGTSGTVNVSIVGEDALRGSIGMHNHPIWDGFESGDAFSLEDVFFNVKHNTCTEYLTSGKRRCSFEYSGRLNEEEIYDEYKSALFEARSIAFENGEVLEYEQEAAMRILAQRLEGFKFDENL